MSRIWSRDWTSDKTLLQIVCRVIVSHHPDDRMTTPSASGPLLEDPEPVMEMSVFLLAASGSYLSSPLLWLIWGRPGSSPQLPFPARPGRWQTGCSSEHSAENMSFSLLSLARPWQLNLLLVGAQSSTARRSAKLQNRVEPQCWWEY